MYTLQYGCFSTLHYLKTLETNITKEVIDFWQPVCAVTPGLNKDLHRQGRCSAWLSQQQHDLGGWWFYLFTLCCCDKEGNAWKALRREAGGSLNHHWQQQPLKIQPHRAELARTPSKGIFRSQLPVGRITNLHMCSFSISRPTYKKDR